MIRVASFNVKNLNMGKDEESMKKRDYDMIASLVRGYDIVVLQEVLSKNIIEGFSGRRETALLTRRLGNSWEGKWVDPKTRSKMYPYLGEDKRGEGFAFLWDARTIELATENGKEILPHRFSGYSTAPGTNQIRLIRDPGYGRFRLKNRPVEIRVITTHIIFGKPKQENMTVEIDHGAITMRKNEFDVLAGRIYKNINDYHKTEKSVQVYTIIIGDYNLNLKGGELSNASIPSDNYYDYFGRPCSPVLSHTSIKTIQDAPTTIKADGSGYANNFDHCSFDSETEHVIVNCYRKPVINGESTEKIKEYRDTVSDHVPIVVELKC